MPGPTPWPNTASPGAWWTAFPALVSGLLLQSILYPFFVRLWETDRDQVPRLAQNTARWLMTAALVVMFVLFIESDRIITLVFGPRYLEAVWLQKVLVVTVAFAFLHNLAAFLMISMQLPRLLLIFSLVGLAVNLLWCSLVIPLDSAPGRRPGHGHRQGRQWRPSPWASASGAWA